MNQTIKSFLLSRPIDYKTYREFCATGATAWLYTLPWWVILGFIFGGSALVALHETGVL